MPRLTQEQQRELVRRYQGGDRYAGDLLLREVQGFIRHVARWYIRPSSADFEDAVQAGGEGFLEGVMRFDGRPVHLLTYARHWIKSGIREFVQNEGAVVRFPARFYRKNQDQSGVVHPQQRGHKQRSVFTFSEMATERNTEDSLSFEDSLIDEAPLADETLSDTELDYWIPRIAAHLMASLSPKARDILMRRFQEPEETLADIGAVYGVSRERIRQLEQEALCRLRNTLTVQRVEKTTGTFQQWVGRLITAMLAEQLALVEVEARKRAADLAEAQRVVDEQRAAKLARSIHAANVAKRRLRRGVERSMSLTSDQLRGLLDFDCMCEEFWKGVEHWGTTDLVLFYDMTDDSLSVLVREQLVTDPEAPDFLKLKVSKPAKEAAVELKDASTAFWLAVSLPNGGMIISAVIAQRLAQGGVA